MNQENVEIVRWVYAMWSKGDFSGGADAFDPDLEYILFFGPDAAEGRGPEAMSRAFGDYLSNWAEWRTGEIDELIEVGDTIVALHGVRARGKHSEAEVELREAAVGFTFRDGKIVWMAVGVRKKVLEAVGLSE